MPVDIHPEEGIPGVELILTRLHAGGKFTNKNYSFPAACTAWASRWSMRCPRSVEVSVSATASEHRMEFADGDRTSALAMVGSGAARSNTGTTRALLARAEVFRLAEDLAAAAQAPAARQGGALPRPDREALRRRQRRARGVVLRGRPARLPARHAGRPRLPAAGTVRGRAGARARARSRLGAGLGAPRANWCRKATSI